MYGNTVKIGKEMNAKELRRYKTFTAAHCAYAKGLRLHAFRKVQDRATGEDLVQETFVKTWRYLVKGGKVDVMKAFLYHVLNDLIVDEYRKRKTTSLDALLDKGFEPNTGHDRRLLDVLDGKAEVLLIARLPVSYQKVMHMRYVEDLSLKEMSLITGQSKNSIAVQAHRGLLKLKMLHNVT